MERIRFGLLCAMWALAAACSSTPRLAAGENTRIVVDLEEAKRLMLSGQVEEVFQPHHGPTTLLLKGGGSRCFVQPNLDWVLGFLKENQLLDKIPVAME